MITKQNAIVLGGIAAHVELIKQLKEQGYNTILVDYLPNPPAKAVADIHLQESTLDKDVVLKIAKEYDAKLVTSGCVDQANITAAYVNEQMGLYTPYSYESALKITNKGYMKEVMMRNGIPTAKFYYIDRSVDPVELELLYPVIVKPADSNSANGVKKANTPDEMKVALDDALEISRNHKAIVEEFIEGREFSAYTYVQEGKAHLLMTNERVSAFDGKNNVIKCYASLMPARLPETLNGEIEDIATKIANSFGLDNTPLFYQALYKDGKFYVIEFAPRYGGGMCFYTIPQNTGFNAIGSIISSQRGEKVDITLSAEPYLSATNTVYAHDCVLDHVEGFDGEIIPGKYAKFFPYKAKGSLIDNKSASASRVGGFVVKADNKSQLIEIIRKVYESSKVISTEGVNEVRTDLSLLSNKDLSE